MKRIYPKKKYCIKEKKENGNGKKKYMKINIKQTSVKRIYPKKKSQKEIKCNKNIGKLSK